MEYRAGCTCKISEVPSDADADADADAEGFVVHATLSDLSHHRSCSSIGINRENWENDCINTGNECINTGNE